MNGRPAGGPLLPGLDEANPNSPATRVTDQVTGRVVRLTYRSDETGYTVARIELDDGGPATVVGHLVGVSEGMTIRMVGEWASHPRYGRQFKVRTFAEDVPATPEGLTRYLADGPIRGIGPSTAARLVDQFGEETLAVLDSSPERLTEVDGIGPVRAAQIAASWAENNVGRELMIFLQGHGVPAGTAARIQKTYGDAAMGVVQREPYRLAREVRGFGFRTADAIALKTGFAVDSPARLEAGTLHALSKLAEQGHTAPQRELVTGTAAEILAAPEDAVEQAVERLVLSGDAALWRDRVGLPSLMVAERAVATDLIARAGRGDSRMPAFAGSDLEPFLEAAVRSQPHKLSHAQAEAVKVALANRVSVITGGPGTGKTTTVRALLQVANGSGYRVKLAAPTGRAARRLSEATGHQAMTVHRLLEYAPFADQEFQHDADNPVDADLVVVDEASMVDSQLMHALVLGLAPGTHLVLVGDADQLPSVGPGNVLADVLASDRLASIRLEEVHRQAAGSQIVVNAHRIRQGLVPEFDKSEGDSFLFKVDDAAAAADMVVDVAVRRIPRRFGLDPVRDLQVLSPMHRGPAGVTELNRRLQRELNPLAQKAGELPVGAFLPGDRVMQTRNDYSREVFNGDQGIVAEVSRESSEVVVDFDGRAVRYPFTELDALTLAYACSVHKSQGSEFPAVVLCLVPAHFVMLQRNLLYTALTRARQLSVVVGSPRALASSVRNDRVAERFTLLAELLLRRGDR